jgi:hypothetical protein
MSVNHKLYQNLLLDIFQAKLRKTIGYKIVGVLIFNDQWLLEKLSFSTQYMVENIVNSFNFIEIVQNHEKLRTPYVKNLI